MRDSFQPKSTREAILDATDLLLGRFGYRKMTIDDLAQEVGIGKGSIYLHFTSKEEIALSHIDRIIDRLKSRLREIAERKASCREKIDEMLVERVLFRFDSVQNYSQSLNELLSQVRTKLLERRTRYFEEEAQLFKAVIEEGIANNEFRLRDSLEAARTLLMATNSLLPYSLSTRELGDRGEIEEKTRRLSDMLLSGL
ncbi:MAG TPA: TetR/AcrR family transcriptional regulator [Pyrinomonadaceae bacterium]|nr:TetR/AcrR family transcriptional regulator [Pyrinomonadaceae bacterium]